MKAERLQLIAEYFKARRSELDHFLGHTPENDPRYGSIRFYWLAERRDADPRYFEYCLLTRSGRFLRLLDEIDSSVDVREAAAYIDSVAAENEELEIIRNEQNPAKQYYLIRDFCPPLYCGPRSR